MVEVLIALSIAALGFGVVLHSLGLQMSLVAGSLERHQMLMYASEAVEANLTNSTLASDAENIPIDENRDQDDDDEEIQARYFYSLGIKPVTADPRIQQVTIQVSRGPRLVRLSAYKLRVRRESNNEEGS